MVTILAVFFAETRKTLDLTAYRLVCAHFVAPREQKNASSFRVAAEADDFSRQVHVAAY
jgi:hypothetical protein